MHAPNGKRAVMVDDVRNKHQRGEERKCLKEICRRLVHTIRQAVKWRNRLFAAASSPTIAALPTDEMRAGDKMNHAQGDACRQHP
jgi:hypothetical protein